ncbi:MAG TPA: hypothetical protein VE981_09800 [Planctomycetota bacterium]|nr:hypothetical protein [Planctomycetota bacterium]
MSRILRLAALAVLVQTAVGCGKDASAGQNWIFYTYTESSSDGKSTNTYTVQECVNIKFVSQATYYPPEASNEKEKQSFLWMKVGGKEVKLYGKQADNIWKSIQSNN